MELTNKRTAVTTKPIIASLASKAFAGSLLLVGSSGCGPNRSVSDMPDAMTGQSDTKIRDGGSPADGSMNGMQSDMAKKGMCPDFTTRTAYVVSIRELDKNKLNTTVLKVGDKVTIGSNEYTVKQGPTYLLLVTDNTGTVNSDGMQLTGVVTLDFSGPSAKVLLNDGKNTQEFESLSVVGIGQISVTASFESNINYYPRAVVALTAGNGPTALDILDPLGTISAKSLDGKTTSTVTFLDGDNSKAVLHIGGTHPKGFIDQTPVIQEGNPYMVSTTRVGVFEVQDEFDAGKCILLTAQIKYTTDTGEQTTSKPLGEGSIIHLNNGLMISLDKLYFDPNPGNQYAKVTVKSDKNAVSAVLNANGDPVTSFKDIDVGSISLVGVYREYIQPGDMK